MLLSACAGNQTLLLSRLPPGSTELLSTILTRPVSRPSFACLTEEDSVQQHTAYQPIWALCCQFLSAIFSEKEAEITFLTFPRKALAPTFTSACEQRCITFFDLYTRASFPNTASVSQYTFCSEVTQHEISKVNSTKTYLVKCRNFNLHVKLQHIHNKKNLVITQVTHNL